MFSTLSSSTSLSTNTVLAIVLPISLIIIITVVVTVTVIIIVLRNKSKDSSYKCDDRDHYGIIIMKKNIHTFSRIFQEYIFKNFVQRQCIIIKLGLFMDYIISNTIILASLSDNTCSAADKCIHSGLITFIIPLLFMSCYIMLQCHCSRHMTYLMCSIIVTCTTNADLDNFGHMNTVALKGSIEWSTCTKYSLHTDLLVSLWCYG